MEVRYDDSVKKVVNNQLKSLRIWNFDMVSLEFLRIICYKKRIKKILNLWAAKNMIFGISLLEDQWLRNFKIIFVVIFSI